MCNDVNMPIHRNPSKQLKKANTWNMSQWKSWSSDWETTIHVESLDESPLNLLMQQKGSDPGLC